MNIWEKLNQFGDSISWKFYLVKQKDVLFFLRLSELELNKYTQVEGAIHSVKLATL